MNVYYLIGCIGSGKSTWAKKHADSKTKIVSADGFREMINGQYKYEPEADRVIDGMMNDCIARLLSCGYDVIIDVCHLTNDRRATWKIPRCHKKIAVVFPIKENEWHVGNRQKLLHGNDNLEKRILNDKVCFQDIDESWFDDVVYTEAF
jgi:predicted kinase